MPMTDSMASWKLLRFFCRLTTSTRSSLVSFRPALEAFCILLPPYNKFPRRLAGKELHCVPKRNDNAAPGCADVQLIIPDSPAF